jgi:hypothetical protein
MNDRYQSSSWSIAVPPAWSIEEAEECIGFIPDDARGALQISAYTKNGLDIPLADLRRFAREGAPGQADPTAVRCGDFRGFTKDYLEDGRAWRAWWLAAGPHHLYITWNSDLKDTGAYRGLVNELVTSLRLTDRAS